MPSLRCASQFGRTAAAPWREWGKPSHGRGSHHAGRFAGRHRACIITRSERIPHIPTQTNFEGLTLLPLLPLLPFLTLLTLLPLLSLLILLTLLTLLTCQSFLVTASQVFPKFQVTCTSGSVPRLQPSVDCMAIMRNRWARTSPGLQGSRWEGYRVSDQETGLPEISTSQYRDESWWIMIQQISPNILKQILNRQHIFPARWRSGCVLGDSLAPQRAPAPRQSPAATGPGTSGTGSSEPAAGGVSLGACFLKTRLSPGWVVKHLLSSCWATGIFLEFCDLDMTQSLAADPRKDCWKHVLRWCSYIFIIFVRPWESGHGSELRKLQPRLGSSGVQQSDQLWQPQGDHHQY